MLSYNLVLFIILWTGVYFVLWFFFIALPYKRKLDKVRRIKHEGNFPEEE